MTKIVHAALLAQRAVIANQAGAVAEPIKNDFGEDLIVQTQVKDAADSFSILVQVKGTRLRAGKDGKFRYRVDVDHLLRWVGHHQPVLVCVYDDVTGDVFSFFPREAFSLWKLATTKNKTLTISLTSDQIFCEKSAKRFIWKCRISYYERMLSWYGEVQRSYYHTNQRTGEARRRSLELEKGVVTFDFLKSIDLFDDAEFHPEFVKSIENCSRNFAKDNEGANEKLNLTHVFQLCLLGHVDRETGCGLPTNLIEYGAYITNNYFKVCHPRLWDQANARLAGVA